MRVIGYTYEADVHCPSCAFNAAAVGLLKREQPLALGSDEHGLAFDLVDREGNPIHPIFSTDEGADVEVCGDCGEELL